VAATAGVRAELREVVSVLIVVSIVSPRRLLRLPRRIAERASSPTVCVTLHVVVGPKVLTATGKPSSRAPLVRKVYAVVSWAAHREVTVCRSTGLLRRDVRTASLSSTATVAVMNSTPTTLAVLLSAEEEAARDHAHRP
jgi:hypothetical protein